MKKNILAAAAFAVSFTLLQACNDSSTTKETTSDTTSKMEGMDHGKNGGGMADHSQMMAKMETHMNAVKMTGDFDVDFANMMIPHHQSAIDMSEEYLPKGKDEKIKTMAQNIITAQKTEIAELQTLIANHKTSDKKDQHKGSDHGDGEHNELMQAMKTMMNSMKSMQMSGDSDKDFVSMMIPHHQSAVEMAEHELSHGKHVEMKKFAQKVLNDQTKEIKEFQDWLASKK